MPRRPKLVAVYEDDAAYPHDRKLKGGQIELIVDIVHDEDSIELLEEVQLIVRRYLRRRGCQIEGEYANYRPQPIWLTPAELRDAQKRGVNSAPMP